MQSYKIEIKPKTIIMSLLVVGLVLLAFELKSVLVMLFIAFILNAGFRPLVDALERRRIPRTLSIFLIYIFVFIVLVLIAVITAAEFASQFKNLIESLPGIFNNVVTYLRENIPFLYSALPLQPLQQEIGDFARNLLESQTVQNIFTGENVISVASQAFGVFGSVAGLLVSLFTVIMVSIYMLQKRDKVYEGLIALLPDDLERSTRHLLRKIESSLGSWLIGQISLMVIIGVLTYILIWVPGLFDASYQLDNFALPIALAAGVLESLPNLGPVLTMILAGIIAFGTTGIGALAYVVIAFAVIQNAEAVFIVPFVMKKAVGIDPILTILGILAAFQLGGVLGALLVVPIIAVVQIAVVEIAKENKEHERQRPKLV